MARRTDRIDHLSDCEFCRDDSHARAFLTDLRKIILRVFATSGFSHSLDPKLTPALPTGCTNTGTQQSCSTCARAEQARVALLVRLGNGHEENNPTVAN